MIILPILNFSPEFDLQYYRRAYPELNKFSDEVLTEHYKRFAVEQGRSTCIYDRREYLQALLQDAIDKHNLKVLEISPWDNPFLRGANVKYFSLEDAEALKNTAIKEKRHFNRTPEKIDFISPTADLGIVNENFDIVFSSHVIEHCPNLVEHLCIVGKILNRGGLYVLIVPDKRYCFDYYNSESTIMEVIDAFVNKRKNPRLADYIYNGTHNNAILHWLGQHGTHWGGGYNETPESVDKNLNREDFFNRIKKYTTAIEDGEYINAHDWRFTPESFGYIVNLLNALEFIDLKLYRLCHTLWGCQEFVALLEKI